MGRFDGFGGVATVYAIAMALVAGAAQAKGGFPPDAPGGADHPLIKRFAGSALIGYKVDDWGQAVLPLSAQTVQSQSGAVLKDKRVVEGKVARLLYVSPVGKAPLEVFRNYEQALNAAGFKKLYGCESDCADLYFAWTKTVDIKAGMAWSTGTLASSGGGEYSVQGALRFDGRMLVGEVTKAGQSRLVLVYTSGASDPSTGMAATYLEIVEPKDMPTGQVAVDAAAMKTGLDSEGKVSLYGLYFDTGKAEVKPESKPQLDEMAKLLRDQPTLKVYIVGHTDNAGTLDANLALSLQRAQAVVAALSGPAYKVDGKRLQARGVASLAPVAANTAEPGRARNRRVELVVQ